MSGARPDASTAPAVSVLIPAWNAAGSIRRALASVLDFRDVALECVVVDDGSTDGTAEVVREAAASDARVVLVALDRNQGVSVARNRGLRVVRGEWLTLLDADDRFLPGGLARLVGAAVRSDALAVIGQQVWTDGSHRWLTPFYDVPDIRRPGRKSLARSPGLLNFVSPHAKLLRRACWEGLEFEGRVLGDQPWVIRALLRAGNRIEVVGETVYEWHRPRPGFGGPRPGAGPGSITTTTRATVDRGLEAIDVAGGALALVRAEARRLLPPGEAEAVERAYLSRLLAMDLAPHVGAALGRSDPGVARLFDAIREFLEAVPAAHLAGDTALARSIVELPLQRWWRVPRSARAAYWRLFDVAAMLDPRLAEHASSVVARLALRLARPPRGAANRAAAASLLMLARLAGGARRALAGAVRGAVSRAPVAR